MTISPVYLLVLLPPPTSVIWLFGITTAAWPNLSCLEKGIDMTAEDITGPQCFVLNPTILANAPRYARFARVSASAHHKHSWKKREQNTPKVKLFNLDSLNSEKCTGKCGKCIKLRKTLNFGKESRNIRTQHSENYSRQIQKKKLGKIFLKTHFFQLWPQADSRCQRQRGSDCSFLGSQVGRRLKE